MPHDLSKRGNKLVERHQFAKFFSAHALTSHSKQESDAESQSPFEDQVKKKQVNG